MFESVLTPGNHMDKSWQFSWQHIVSSHWRFSGKKIEQSFVQGRLKIPAWRGVVGNYNGTSKILPSLRFYVFEKWFAVAFFPRAEQESKLLSWLCG